MHWQPHKYQEDAIRFMIERGAAGLFMDPGLGKTSITLAAFKVLKSAGYAHRMLVVAPLRVCQLVWPVEVAKWNEFRDLRVVVLHGKDKDKLARQDADVFVINPEGIYSAGRSWYFDYAHRFVKPDMLVIDESTRFKNQGSKRFKALRPHIPEFPRRYILSGTPAPKGFEDLFAQIFILDQGAALGRYITHYRRQHFDPASGSGHITYSWKLKEGHDKIILDKIAPFCLRLKDRDFLELPELVENNVEVELPEDAQEIYRDLEDEFITTIQDEEVVALSAASLSIKLRQVCNGAIYNEVGEPLFIHTQKVEALESLVEEAQSPVFCLTEFKHDVDNIRKKFPDAPYIGSGTSESAAMNAFTSFNRGELPLLLAHPASAGHGLNLQERCFHVVMYGLPWDLELYDQAIKRVLRQGNPHKRVFLHRIIVRGSIENAMLGALISKDRTQQAMLNHLREFYLRRTQNVEG